jgi:hypothetical protein
VTYKNGRIQLKPLDKYIASKKPNKEELFINWLLIEQTRKGWVVPGYPTNERFKLISESYLSHQFDMDGDGDFDTATWKENRLCQKSESEKAYQMISQCKPVGEMFFFRNDNGKFTVSDRHEIDPGATIALYNFDINKDGNMDFYALRDEHSTWECNNQINNIFFGNGDGTFRRPSVMEQSKIFGNYGCEIQSYFFDFEGESYRTFFTHKYSKNFSGTRAVYVGVERIASSQEKAEYIAEEEAKAAEEDLIEKELAEFEAQLEAELAEERASIFVPDNAYISGSNWFCNAGYIKIGNSCNPIPTNAHKYGSRWVCNAGYTKTGNSCKKNQVTETETVDTEQSVEDEIAAFEAELEAELGQ